MVADGGKLELQLQGLPLPAKFLTSEVPYRGDNVHVIVLASIPLNADLFDGQTHSGPVPLLFSSHKEETLASLLANPQLAHAGNPTSLTNVVGLEFSDPDPALVSDES